MYPRASVSVPSNPIAVLQVCRAWRALIAAGSIELWHRQIAHDFPLFARALEASEAEAEAAEAAIAGTAAEAAADAQTEGGICVWSGQQWHLIHRGVSSMKVQVLNMKLRVVSSVAAADRCWLCVSAL